ncbi:MAG: HAMP domain-containing sensor histidine kinase [Sterolibacterium sp.]
MRWPKVAAPGSLFGRLVLTQIVFGAFLALGFIAVLEVTHTRYHMETTQRQDLGWAAEILSRYRAEFAAPGQHFNIELLREFLRDLGNGSPARDYYAIDSGGNILASSVSSSLLKRSQVDVSAVESLLRNPRELPVTIDDPAAPGSSRVFSAARIDHEGVPTGYLLLLLPRLDAGLLAFGRDSRIFREALVMMVAVSVLAFAAALVILRFILKPIRELSRSMRVFRSDSEIVWTTEDGKDFEPDGSEVESLIRHFNDMARQLVLLLHRLKDEDRKMRETFAVISHDLRTPLTVIHSCVETLYLKGSTLPTSECSRLSGVAMAQARSLGRLLDSVFDLSRLQSRNCQINCETFSIAEAVQDIALKFSVRCKERGITIRISGGDRHIHVSADVLLVERVFDNLIDNALRHAHGADEIVIRLIVRPGEVEVTFADNGSGLPEVVAKRLLAATPSEICYAGASEHGAGMGLSIVRRIMELHGTKFELVAGENDGAGFRFMLPKPGNLDAPTSASTSGTAGPQQLTRNSDGDLRRSQFGSPAGSA